MSGEAAIRRPAGGPGGDDLNSLVKDCPAGGPGGDDLNGLVKDCPVRERVSSDFAEDWAILREDIDPADFEQLKLFREALRCKDEHAACKQYPAITDPYVLLRTLIAFDFDVQAAAAWYGGEYLDWRESMDLVNRLSAWRAELAEGRSRRAALMRDHFAVTDVCNDAYGIPIVLYRFGVMDMSGLVREVGSDAIIMQWLHFAEHASERLSECCRKHRKFIPGQIHIYDVGDYPQQVPDWSTRMWYGGMAFLEALKPIKYPNVVRKTFAIRSSFAVRNLYRLLYPALRVIISQQTLDRLRFYGQSASDWEAELRAELDASQTLPDFLVSESEAAFAAAEPTGGFLPVGVGASTGFTSCSGGEDVTDEDDYQEDFTDGIGIADDAEMEQQQAKVVGIYNSSLNARQDSVIIIKDDLTFWHAHTVKARTEDAQTDRGVCVQIGSSLARCAKNRDGHVPKEGEVWEQIELIGTYEFAPGGQIILTCEGFRTASGRGCGEDLGSLMLWPLRSRQSMLDGLLERRDLRLHYRFLGGGGAPGFQDELFRVREEIDAGSFIDLQTVNVLLSCLGFPKTYSRLPRKETSPPLSRSSSITQLSLLSLPIPEAFSAEGSDADDEFLTPRSHLSAFSVLTFEERVKEGIREWAEQNPSRRP